MRQSRFFLLWMVTLACVCAQAQQAPASEDNTQSKSTVYVYRYKQFVGAALAPSVYCDDQPLARMENGRYFMVTVDPGKHTFRSNDPQSGILLEMKPGEQYFIRVEIATGFMKGHGRLVLMSREQASYELDSSKLKPLDADKVADKQRVSVEVVHLQAAATQTAAPKAAPASTPQIVPASAKGASSVEVIAQPEPAAEPRTVNGTTINGNGGGVSSMSGDQISVGEAARRSREKKQQQPQMPQQ